MMLFLDKGADLQTVDCKMVSPFVNCMEKSNYY